MSNLSIKRGDTFVLLANITDSLGDPMVYTVEQIKSQVRTRDNDLLSDLTVAETAEQGKYELKAADTTKWPIGEVFMDIQVTDQGVVTSSNTIVISVEKDVTQ